MARILVVDDEELARFTAREILENAGHEVSEADNGNTAIAKQQAQPYNLILTDIIMPEMEGIETIMELKKKFPDLKIISMSGGGKIENADYLHLAKQLGADAILSKPFTNDELLEAVKALL